MMTCKSPYIQYMYSYPHKTAYRPLKGISLWDYAHLLAGSGHGLYLNFLLSGYQGYQQLPHRA